MTKTQEYQIIEATSTTEVSARVNRLTVEGWRVSGSLQVAVCPQFEGVPVPWFFQALVRDAVWRQL